jgi:hypothetical protein
VTNDWTHTGANRQILIAAAFAPTQTGTDSAGGDNSVIYGGIDMPTRTTGLWGYGQRLRADKTNSILVSNTSDIDVTGNMSVTALFNVDTDAVTGWKETAILFARGQEAYRVRRDGAANYLGFSRITYDGTYLPADGTLVNVADGSFHHLVYDFNTTSGAKLYVDSTINCSDSNVLPTQTSTKPLRFGWNEDVVDRIFAGKMEELRFAALTRSANWVTTERNALMSPQTFWSVGQPSLTYPHINVT